MQVEKIQGSNFSINRIESEFDGVDGVDATFIEAMTDKISVMHQLKQEIAQALTNPVLTSDPGALIAVQAMIADYNLNIEYTAKIASTLLKNVDTLVKS